MQFRIGDRVAVPVLAGKSDKAKRWKTGVVVGLYPRHVGVMLDSGWRESFFYEDVTLLKRARTGDSESRQAG